MRWIERAVWLGPDGSFAVYEIKASSVGALLDVGFRSRAQPPDHFLARLQPALNVQEHAAHRGYAVPRPLDGKHCVAAVNSAITLIRDGTLLVLIHAWRGEYDGDFVPGMVVGWELEFGGEGLATVC